MTVQLANQSEVTLTIPPRALLGKILIGLEPVTAIGNLPRNRVPLAAVRIKPDGFMLVLHNNDAPGVIGNVGLTLGEARVNIAQFALARDKARGEALALVNVDSPASAEVLDRLRKLPNVRRVHQVAL